MADKHHTERLPGQIPAHSDRHAHTLWETDTVHAPVNFSGIDPESLSVR